MLEPEELPVIILDAVIISCTIYPIIRIIQALDHKTLFVPCKESVLLLKPPYTLNPFK